MTDFIAFLLSVFPIYIVFLIRFALFLNVAFCICIYYILSGSVSQLIVCDLVYYNISRTSYRHSLYHLSYTFWVWGKMINRMSISTRLSQHATAATNKKEEPSFHASMKMGSSFLFVVQAHVACVLRDYSTVYGINAIFLALLIAVVRAL